MEKLEHILDVVNKAFPMDKFTCITELPKDDAKNIWFEGMAISDFSYYVYHEGTSKDILAIYFQEKFYLIS